MLAKKKSQADSKLPLNRIKKIMQQNQEIGKIQSTTPLAIAKALELFIEDITKQAAQVALRNQDTKINPSHIKAVILGGDGAPKAQSEKFTFLKEAVAKIPDLKLTPTPAPYELPSPKQQEQICK